MRVDWIAEAEQHLPAEMRGAVSRVLQYLDGSRDWHPITTAPFNCDVDVRLAAGRRRRVIPFPCRQTRRGWINADLGVRVNETPSDWRAARARTR
jgi:hypothetical protein